MVSPPELAARWLDLWERLGLHGDGQAVFDDLIARYAEPHRAYHTLDHIQHCLAELDDARDLAQDPDLIEWALWFHDAVYDTHAADSEARSRDLMLAVMREAGAQPDQMDKAVVMVMATKHTAVEAGAVDDDTRLLVDIDLSILGQPKPRFDAYEEAVRREYAWVPWLLFRKGRSAILTKFAAEPRLFATPRFHARYQAAARENLERSLARLKVPLWRTLLHRLTGR